MPCLIYFKYLWIFLQCDQIIEGFNTILSSQEYPTSIHITAVLTRYTTRTGRIANGVATSWLKKKVPNGPQTAPTVPIYVRKSQFRLPFKASTPVIMIGPGTGLAPFRGFIQERHHAKTDGMLYYQLYTPCIDLSHLIGQNKVTWHGLVLTMFMLGN